MGQEGLERHPLAGPHLHQRLVDAPGREVYASRRLYRCRLLTGRRLPPVFLALAAHAGPDAFARGPRRRTTGQPAARQQGLRRHLQAAAQARRPATLHATAGPPRHLRAARRAPHTCAARRACAARASTATSAHAASEPDTLRAMRDGPKAPHHPTPASPEPRAAARQMAANPPSRLVPRRGQPPPQPARSCRRSGISRCCAAQRLQAGLLGAPPATLVGRLGAAIDARAQGDPGLVSHPPSSRGRVVTSCVQP